jgi:hypothetical protein
VHIAHVTAVGFIAHAALLRAAGAATVRAPLSASIYVEAGGDLIWVGPHTSGLHGRAVLCTDARALAEGRPLSCDTLMLDVSHVAPWRPRPGPQTAPQAAAMLAGAARLRTALPFLGAPDGLARLWTGAAPSFPLGESRTAARALAQACVRDDAEASAVAAGALLGLGPGLTPSGDDFVGAAFFARVLLARAGGAEPARWRTAADRVLSEARARTHPISATLLADLLDGGAYEPLHDLAHLLATRAPGAVVDEAARAVVGIGHTSGWDLLAGFLAGCCELPV